MGKRKGAVSESIVKSRKPEPAKTARFIPFPKAFNRLTERMNATSDEVAAWVFLGPEYGGLRAYLNANELDPPPRFFYGYQGDEQFDYLAPLMACWFDEDEVAAFSPKDRFITGQALIDRWNERPGIRPRAFIQAKIEESRLYDLHPSHGGTRGVGVHDESIPRLAAGLFCLGDIEKIEAADFGDSSASVDREPVTTGPPKEAEEWLTERARAAANAKHAKPGGSREKRMQILAIWAAGNYTSRDKCAEEECRHLGMSFKTARNALVGAKNPGRRGHN